ncbi:Choline transport ATP-binding protein OpuBA [Fusobacterium sp. DD29]|uniref:ABC transporter ATP-binding protein n=2 Tax=unclassified Fusobacterium TaxID=2648384 RepID=UPI001B8A9073|nr:MULTISPECIES: ATP-binding cassette domain-containing protein [unclassified Fusobacterium]MBR8749727.1 Choline transport ATP-binding protein OpuBA [Fusobacterium sp. DD29]MBR8768006.1 Choline transport ATP-binding protein OpuBA [Fusobacterium sp. DD43]MBR8772055.1 Choline transport ATP-binding protein OpuBA [Fusobacterium sp. DD40]MBR8776300.1 Choline transport ATP-binding protein OpuBA [Fusobacterium sp. DD17]MBR8798570.1 Choline transport ATP-binding protein OpuBA [Fusobacterium sp. DD12]
MLVIKNLKKTFNAGTENEVNIFNGLNLEVNDSEFVAILGSNGCGKSTLFNLISGSIKDNGGDIILGDTDLGKMKEEERALKIGKVHQDPSRGVSPSLTILENLSLAAKKSEKFSLRNLIKKQNTEKFIELLKELDLGLENKLNTQVKFLSGGQRQALSLIMATLKKPELLLLDEHTAALDPKTSAMIMNKTKKLIDKQKITAMMISHNLRDAVKYADRIIMLDKGQVILDVKSTDITERELSNIYISKIGKEERIAC